MLQYLAYLNQYEIIYPANAAIYNKYLVSFIEFKGLDPQNIIQKFYPLFTYGRFLTGTYESVSSLDGINQIIVVISVFLVVVILLLLLLVVPKTNEFAKKKL
jgi:hypothetical protein